jgi:hypothetical protein
MALFTFNQITLTLLISCAIFSIASVCTNRWNGSSSLLELHKDTITTTTKILIISGTVGVCLGLFIQILINVSSQFAVSRAVQLLCLIFVMIGLLGLLVGVIVYGVDDKYGCKSASQCGYSYWFSVIASVLVVEASIFYIIAWRCP